MSNDKKQASLKSEKNMTDKKKWTKKKTVAAIIIGAAVLSFVVFMILVLVMQLGPIRPIKSTAEEAKAVGACGGYEVKYEELRYITLLHKASLNAEMENYEELDATARKAYEDELELRVLQSLKSNYKVLSLCDEYGIDTDSLDVDDHVQDEIEALIEDKEAFDGDVKKYKEWLAENGLTDSFLRLMYKVNYLETILLDYFVENKIDIAYDSEDLNAFVKYVMSSEDWARTIHVYYPLEHPWSDPDNVPAEMMAVDREYIEKTVSKYNASESVQKAYEHICSGKNGEERFYIMQKSEVAAAPTTEFTISGNGLYFTHGQMNKLYETAAFALEPYDVSEIIALDEGYYIIMRLPLDEDDVRKNAKSLLSQYQYAALKKHLDAREGEISFEGNAYFDSLVLVDIE